MAIFALAERLPTSATLTVVEEKKSGEGKGGKNHGQGKIGAMYGQKSKAL